MPDRRLRSVHRLAGAGLVLAGLAGTGLAQVGDCPASATQLDMTRCAEAMWRSADEDLNLAYGMAMDMARALDSGLASGQIPGEDMLRQAQRNWIVFRDTACAAESNLARGGSMQPMLVYICMERLTRQRTEDLRLFGETN